MPTTTALGEASCKGRRSPARERGVRPQACGIWKPFYRLYIPAGAAQSAAQLSRCPLEQGASPLCHEEWVHPPPSEVALVIHQHPTVLSVGAVGNCLLERLGLLVIGERLPERRDLGIPLLFVQVLPEELADSVRKRNRPAKKMLGPPVVIRFVMSNPCQS